MPAAKIDKSSAASGETTIGKSKIASNTNGTSQVNNATNLSQDPQKIANTIIDKKIRNLEKRKVKVARLWQQACVMLLSGVDICLLATIRLDYDTAVSLRILEMVACNFLIFKIIFFVIGSFAGTQSFGR